MVQIPALSTPECPGGQQEEEHGVVNHVQVEHYQRKERFKMDGFKSLSPFLIK